MNALDDDTPTVTGQISAREWGFELALRLYGPAGRQHAPRRRRSTPKASSQLRQASVLRACGRMRQHFPSQSLDRSCGIESERQIALHQGAVDIGQGSNTIVTQICADALRAPIERFDLVSGDTSITPDCGKTSASRQTFVTGKAAHMAGSELRLAILRLANACKCADIVFENDCVKVKENETQRTISLRDLRSISTATFLPPRPPSIRPPVRSMKMDRAFPTPYSDSEPISPRLRSIQNWALCVC